MESLLQLQETEGPSWLNWSDEILNWCFKTAKQCLVLSDSLRSTQLLIDFIFELGDVFVTKGLEVGVSVFVEFLLGLLHNVVKLLLLDTSALFSILIDAFDHGNGDFVERVHVFLGKFLKHVFFSLLNCVVEGILHEDSKETGLVLQVFLETFKELSILLDKSIIELVFDGGSNTSILESLEVFGF